MSSEPCPFQVALLGLKFCAHVDSVADAENLAKHLLYFDDDMVMIHFQILQLVYDTEKLELNRYLLLDKYL